MGSSFSQPSPKSIPSQVLRNLLSLRRRPHLGSSDDPLHPRDVTTLTNAMEFIVLSSLSSSKHSKEYQQQQKQRIQRQYIQAKRLYERMSPSQRKSLRHKEPVKNKPRSYAQLLVEIKKECNIILHGLPPVVSFGQHTLPKQVFIRNVLLPMVSQKFTSSSLDSDVQSLLSSLLPPNPTSPHPPGV